MGRMKQIEAYIRMGGDDAMEAVSQLLPRWIPVGERLPDAADAYLVVCDEQEDGEQIVVSTGQYEGDGHWTPDYNHMLPSYVVTHWMPPPEPPEVE
jgi:hypothetical protein